MGVDGRDRFEKTRADTRILQNIERLSQDGLVGRLGNGIQ